MQKKYIGNIVVNSQKYKVEDCFKKCLSMSEVDITLPILIIGLENARENILDFSILKREYNNGMLWWTFSKTEKRTDYDKNIIDFYNFCISNIINKISFTNINIFDLKRSDIRKYLKFFNSDVEKYYYNDNGKYVFVYDKENHDNSKHIYGLSLNTIAFLGITKNKIVSRIAKNPKNKQIKVFYSIPNNIRNMVKDDIPSEMVLFDYFT